MTQDAFIRIEQLSKAYREGETLHTVLDRLDLDIEAGSIVAILGRSGSGKSTLLNLVSGIDRPDSGAVWIGQQNVTALGERARTLLRRGSVGFLFQFFNLIPTLTVWENVTLPVELNGGLIPDARRRVETLLDEVGLLERRTAYPEQLSGGEQQRIALARALAHNPEILLADEPTGNLDEETGRHVMGLLERLARESGRTCLLATHSREVAGAADRVLRLEHGRIVPAASPDPDHGD